jgi:transcriptional regulator CtsR
MFEEDDLVRNLVPAVKQQLESKQTPFVKKTLDRLLETGVSEDEAEMMIALCLADESNRMFIDKRDFNLVRYQELLDALPELPEG